MEKAPDSSTLLVTVLNAVIKYLSINNVRGNGFILTLGLRVFQFIISGQTGRRVSFSMPLQRLPTHISRDQGRVRKGCWNSSAISIFLFRSFQDALDPGMMPHTVRSNLFTSFSCFSKHLTKTHKSILQKYPLHFLIYLI